MIDMVGAAFRFRTNNDSHVPAKFNLSSVL